MAGGGSTGLMPTSIACTEAPQVRAMTQLAAKPARMDSKMAGVTAQHAALGRCRDVGVQAAAACTVARGGPLGNCGHGT